MIEIQNVQTIDGKVIDHTLDGGKKVIDGSGLLMLPALVDPHVHFRTPGAEHKENWETAARAAISGGVTTVFDMPNNTPSCVSEKRLDEKIAIIDEQLRSVGIPLRYGLYLGADQNHLDEIQKVKDRIVGIKVYMGSSTGDLLMNDPKALDRVFQLAAENDVLVAVHAEDEEMIEKRKKELSGSDPMLHSVIRNPEVATRAVTQAIDLAAQHRTRLYIAHVSTAEELKLIKEAKKSGVSVFAEATPHHLFLTTKAYEKWGTRALVNPPLRESTESLWDGIHDGTIDTIGTDHAPHLLKEKDLPYGKAPSGFPSIELYLPLLLNAYHEKKISLQKIVSLTSTGPQKIFRVGPSNDIVLVDLMKEKVVDNNLLKTKAKWSPYEGMVLRGWPRYTILKGKVYEV